VHPSNAELGMKILQSEITGTQTSFSTNFGGKMSFIMSFIFPERFHCCYIFVFTAVSCTATIVTLEPFAFFGISYGDLIKFQYWGDMYG
jgi:hypothetical protein